MQEKRYVAENGVQGGLAHKTCLSTVSKLRNVGWGKTSRPKLSRIPVSVLMHIYVYVYIYIYIYIHVISVIHIDVLMKCNVNYITIILYYILPNVILHVICMGS